MGNTKLSARSDRDVGIPETLAAWLDRVNDLRRTQEQLGYKRTPTVVREALETMTRMHVTTKPPVTLVVDDLVPGFGYPVSVRIYHPDRDSAPPVAIFVHGGGHVAGSVVVYDAIARKLAIATGHIIVSVDYRLAPECPYPAGLQDVITAIKGCREVLTQQGISFEDRLSLIGDSGGGALCATAAHLLQYDASLSLDAQVLIYPSLDYTLSMPSIVTLGEGFLLDRSRVAWYFDQYFQCAEDRRDVSPLFMPIEGRFPRSLVLTAEYCLLKDEAMAYVARLRQAGFEAEHMPCQGMIHAFLNLEDLVPDVCAQVYKHVGGFLHASNTESNREQTA